MDGSFGHKGHLVRVAALFAASLVAFFVLRALFVPAGFGLYGHYRAGAIEENRLRPVAFAGRAACVECHSDVPDAMKGGPHERVRCEACHGPLAAHAGDPAEKKAVRPDSRVLCARCHAASVARPARFPQIDVADHAGQEACTTCHAAHNPLAPPATSAGPAPPTPGPQGGGQKGGTR
ncbi:MAG TPA: cytochrome C [Vicinamibacteria bacterium]|nr:cytochrome C [Vicinamibacteria bacterium]